MWYSSVATTSLLVPFLEKYSKNTIEDLNEFYSCVDNYRILLNSYKDLYLGYNTFLHKVDPNIKFQSIALSYGLITFEHNLDNIRKGLVLINDGKWYWRTFKSYQFYRIIAILLGLLFISVPNKDEL